MKSITLFGNVGKQPEPRTTQSGQKVCGFSLAVNDGFGDNKRTLWFDCSVWGKRGEAIATNVNKGDRLCVTGDFSTREYEGKTYLTVNVNDFSFVGGGKQGGGQSQGEQDGGYGSGGGPNSSGDLDQEIPFSMEWR
jgi:single-strand DNA-binding protein